MLMAVEEGAFQRYESQPRTRRDTALGKKLAGRKPQRRPGKNPAW